MNLRKIAKAIAMVSRARKSDLDKTAKFAKVTAMFCFRKSRNASAMHHLRIANAIATIREAQQERPRSTAAYRDATRELAKEQVRNISQTRNRESDEVRELAKASKTNRGSRMRPRRVRDLPGQVSQGDRDDTANS